MRLLEISNLTVKVTDKVIVDGLSLVVNPGEVHAIMGPNGSGKSTFANALAGKPDYEVVSGDILLAGKNIQDWTPEARAHAGLFLAFQYPVEIPGISNLEFLKVARDQHLKANNLEVQSAVEFMKQIRELAASLDLNPEFLKRGVNEGFSGGEKKRNEILQMLMLQPKVAVLDETDSGLDIDALQTVAAGINRYRNKDNGIILVTHYQRLLDHIQPDFVHVLVGGKIVKTGDKSLALELEERGYSWLLT